MKKCISVVLVLAIVLNVFGLGFLNVIASADDEQNNPGNNEVAFIGVDDLLISLIASDIVGVAGGMASGYGESLDSYFANHYNESVQNTVDRINLGAIGNGELIQVNVSGDNAYFSPVDGISGDDLEFASFISSYFNEHTSPAVNAFMNRYDSDVLDTWFGVQPIKRIVDENLYSSIKTDAVNAFTAYLEMKQRSIDCQNYQNAMSELATALGGEWDPEYEFSFVGPVDPIKISGVSGLKNSNIDLNGFTLMPPHYCNSISNYGCTSEVEAWAYHPDNVKLNYGQYYLPIFNNVHQVYGVYIVYNNDIYFLGGKSNSSTSPTLDQLYVNQTKFSLYTSPSGVSLSSVLSNNNDVLGCPCGVYYRSDDTIDSLYPSITYSDDDIYTSSSGATVDYPLTSYEKIAADAYKLHLADENSEFTIGSDGEITAIDGVDLSTLENLVQQLADSQYSFSDIESYLIAIQTLLENGNADTETIACILENVRSYEQQNANALSQINANIASISDTLTMEGEIENTQQEFSFVVGEHTGLAEANEFVSQWTLVNQCKGLLYNILNGDRFTDNPPNFHFYYDSDGDGVQEVYNAFDLSFMENRLTNTNLEDKSRFNQPITVREFIQGLIILFCYVGFVINLLRKLSGLVTGGESAASTGLDIAKYDSMNTVTPLKSNYTIKHE